MSGFSDANRVGAGARGPRSFNIAGPSRPDRHYMLPPLDRLPEAAGVVEQQGYFVVHAPRQSGKTTTLRALAAELTRSGRYAALTVSCEAGSAAGDDYVAAQGAVLDEIRYRADISLPLELRPASWPGAAGATLLRAGLAAWARECPRPVVLFLDEVDALGGQSLVTVLSQLRAGYDERPDNFPASVVLCGLRDVREYGAPSLFNVSAEPFRLPDFTIDDVAALYEQHTTDTGQVFTKEGIEYAFELSQGQPWLVNALAREVIERMGVPPSESIGPRRLETAKERLSRQRTTHLESLIARLRDPRVRAIIEPVILGDVVSGGSAHDDDVRYVRDLGLIAPDQPIRIANPIYREMILRALGSRVEANITVDPGSFVSDDGRLDFSRLLEEFAAFWRRHGDVLTEREAYHEAAPQLAVMAYLHRIVDAGGFVDRDYGIGRGRIDLCVRWPYENDNGKRVWQYEAMELKVWHSHRPDPLPEGLDQVDEYLDSLELGTATLVIFDRREDAAPVEERVLFETARTPAGRTVEVLWA